MRRTEQEYCKKVITAYGKGKNSIKELREAISNIKYNQKTRLSEYQMHEKILKFLIKLLAKEERKK